jgi:hypothetical protein
MPRRPPRREHHEHRRRLGGVAAFGRKSTAYAINCLLSPASLLPLVVVVTVVVQGLDGRGALQDIAAIVVSPSPGSGSDDLAGPAAGRTATAAREVANYSQLVDSDRNVAGGGADAAKSDRTEAETSRQANVSAAAQERGSAKLGSRHAAPRERRGEAAGASRDAKSVGPASSMHGGGGRSADSPSPANLEQTSRLRKDFTGREADSGKSVPASASPSATKGENSGEVASRTAEGAKEQDREARVRPEGVAVAKQSARLKTVHASEVERPKGAMVHGAVGEFLGSHLEDGSSMVRGQNVTRLSYALYKIVRLFNLKKLVDFPSGAHVEWMPEMVTRFEYDIPGFSYEGLDTTEERVAASRVAGEGYGNAEFKVADPEVEVPASGADMMLVWTELDGERTDPRSADYAAYIFSVVRAAKRAGVRYITFGQYPRLRGQAPIYAKGRWRFLGKSKEEVRGVVRRASCVVRRASRVHGPQPGLADPADVSVLTSTPLSPRVRPASSPSSSTSTFAALCRWPAERGVTICT